MNLAQRIESRDAGAAVTCNDPHVQKMQQPEEPLDRREFLALLAGGAAAASFPRLAFADPPEGRKLPNIVIILTDDQGYQDAGCFGSPKIKTPRLDKMAKEGTRFTSFYVPAPVCTPSRAGLMTGCYPLRVGLPRVLFPKSRTGINADETTMAEMLKTRGYATACIGKWHLGHLPPFLPTRHGFDRYYGIPYSNDMRPCPLMRGEKIIEQPAKQATLTERYTGEAVRFIAENKARPFFLYLPHTMPHVPLHVSERFKGKSERGLYGDVIECIDWSTGKILDALEEHGVDNNTLVIFTSDNGPWLVKGKNGGSALPLRGAKATVWEGGMRVLCIMRWPGRIPAGKVCDELATTMDLFPTIARLAGANVPRDRTIDGKDIWPLMAATAGAATPHEAFYYYAGNRLGAVRSGKWKLHFPRGSRRKGKKARPPALYDLEADIGEKKNVAAEHADVVARLTKLAKEFDAALRKNRRPPGRAAAPKKKKAASKT